ncbi:hypothetical protein FGG08_005720 [Glutinoglossum americanum]|uniref:GED domain-containing protein n=1 Tax=Glutinoglossum americanum TaxID=1670608 RepID=A0A9P8HXX0_9PEZI|nr:hypothetical protein FGG08_005720 [Glutinoglossum americanum]
MGKAQVPIRRMRELGYVKPLYAYHAWLDALDEERGWAQFRQNPPHFVAKHPPAHFFIFDSTMSNSVPTQDFLDCYPDSSGSTEPFDISARNAIMDEGYQTASATMPIGSIAATGLDEECGGHLRAVSEEPPKIPVKDQSPSHTASPEPSLELLGRGMREMVEVINRLRQAGIEDFVLPLPKIAVVGNQSAGKSSLIEAISGIRVPRYTGSYPCPLEINLTESAFAGSQWTCRISLRHKFFHNPPDIRCTKSEPFGDMSPRSDLTNHDPQRGSLGPWVERQIAQDIHFKDITDKNEVEAVLVRAQKAILNPSQDWKRFLPTSNFHSDEDDREKEDFEVKFSPNIVRMNISGPGLPNLSFVDLPGIIEAPETDSEMYLVPLIKELVRGYIDNKDCLVLLAVPMTDDAENQSASSIAKQICKERCIGALTKPDMVQPGEHGKWKKILEGYKHELQHGYFVTKQPPQARLKDGIDHLTARKEELEFFRTHEPWKTELSNASDRAGKPLRDRFGTLALQTYLSQTLTELIKDRLPDIKVRVTEEADKVNEELLSLPEPPVTNLVKQLCMKLLRFQWVIAQDINGANDHNKLNEDWQNAADRFAEIIVNSSPKLKLSKDKASISAQAETGPASQRAVPHTPGTPTPTRERTKVINTISLDSDDEVPSQPLSKGRKRTGAAEIPSTPVAKRVKKASEYQTSVRANRVAKVFTLEEIRQESRRVSNNRIRHQVDPNAITHLTKLAMKRWDEPMRKFIDQTSLLFRESFKKAISEVFHEYKNTALFREVHSITDTFLREQIQEQFHTVNTYYRQEVDLVFTLKDLTSEKKAVLRRLEEDREQARRDEIERENQARRQQMEECLTPQQKSKMPKLPNSAVSATRAEEDEFHKELEYLAEVRVYYDHASTRFVDNVCASTLLGIFVACRENLHNLLFEKLGIDEPGADERCKRLMVENDDRERRRADLREKKKMLDKALDELARLG